MRGELRTFLTRLTDAPVMVGVVGVLLLLVIWWATFKLAGVERDAAQRAVVSSTMEMTETYEAQVVRTLREIGQALRLVRFMLHEGAQPPVIQSLEENNLLPPALLFTVAYTDASGKVIESTRDLPAPSVAGMVFFEAQRDQDSPAVGLPWEDPESDMLLLPFSYRLTAPDGGFDGIVAVLVDAAHFVSTYGDERLGNQGLIGLAGTDGIFRIQRSGDEFTSGTHINALGLSVEDMPQIGDPVTRHEVVWDDSRHIVGVQSLFDFPLTIVVGLSQDEWLADAAGAARAHVLRGLAASALVIAVLFMLGRMGWQVQKERAHAFEEQSRHTTRIEHLAYHDVLTGLPNRAYFMQFLADSISQSRRYNRKLAILLMDLDRFKFVNDALGHGTGDDLLEEISSRLKSAMRESDFVARFGGDEFVILVPEVKAEHELSDVANRVLNLINEPFQLAGREIRMTSSIGISTFPEDGRDEESLLKYADIAMYHAKNEGKNNFQYYSSKLSENSIDRLALESGLEHAIENEEFVLFYQGRVDSRNNRIIGAEALVRWNRPGIGLVSPLDFIPLAEETGQIMAIGGWVLREACRQCVEWHKNGYPGFRMAVNLSARQFSDEAILENLCTVLEQTGMDPGCLDLEITESMLMRDLKQTTHILDKLRDLGIRIAVDDFGTGYSSLSTLKLFPLDVIKIDGSFVRGALDDHQDRSLTEAIIAVGHALGLRVVAEGVESSTLAEFLDAWGCDELQGYYVNRPTAAKNFTKLLTTWRASVETQQKLFNTSNPQA